MFDSVASTRHHTRLELSLLKVGADHGGSLAQGGRRLRLLGVVIQVPLAGSGLVQRRRSHSFVVHVFDEVIARDFLQ